jgi:hypothetical protein
MVWAPVTSAIINLCFGVAFSLSVARGMR